MNIPDSNGPLFEWGKNEPTYYVKAGTPEEELCRDLDKMTAYALCHALEKMLERVSGGGAPVALTYEGGKLQFLAPIPLGTKLKGADLEQLRFFN